MVDSGGAKTIGRGGERTMELPGVPQALASQYPHVWEKVVDTWGTLACSGYLSSLVIVEPGRNRAGFSPAALEEIMKLAALHNERFPHHAPLPKKHVGNTWQTR